MFSGTVPDLGCKTYHEISSIHPAQTKKLMKENQDNT